MRLFVDSSILFSACYSKTGGARELIRLAIKGQVELFASDYVFAETELNLSESTPHALTAFHYIKAREFWRVVTVSRDDVSAAIGAVADKFDAPIVAAAKAANVDFLLSFDRKHLHTHKVEAFIGMPVTTPGIVLRRIRSSR
jgi:predicted nucleic acid-binding protein